MWAIPLLGSERVNRAAGAAAGKSGRVIVAACWAGMPKKAFAKIATPRKTFSEFLFTVNAIALLLRLANLILCTFRNMNISVKSK